MFNVVDTLVQGLRHVCQGTEAGLLMVHGSRFGRMPFLPPLMTHMGTSGCCFRHLNPTELWLLFHCDFH